MTALASMSQLRLSALRLALPVYKNDLSVVKAGRVHPHLASLFHELVGIVKPTIGCEGDVASR